MQKFEDLSPDNLPSAQSFLKMNEESKLDVQKPLSSVQKVKSLATPLVNDDLLTSIDLGVKPTSSSTKSNPSDVIEPSTNNNLPRGHPSTLPTSQDDAVSTLQPDANTIGQLKPSPSKSEQVTLSLAQPGSSEFSFSSGDACRSREDSLAPINLLKTPSSTDPNDDDPARVTHVCHQNQTPADIASAPGGSQLDAITPTTCATTMPMVVP